MTRFALVTGASAGIGQALARRLAADRWDVVLVARTQSRLDALAAELRDKHGVRAEVVVADLAAPHAGRAVFEEVERRGLAIELLVNNAGLGSCGPFWTLAPEREVEQVQVNVAALVTLSRLFLPGMLARGAGHLVNIGSSAGFQPGPGMATYYATKAFVLSFSEALAEELRTTPVRVTVVCPGPVATEFAAAAGNDKTMIFDRGVVDADTIARQALAAMARGQVISVPSAPLWLGTVLVRFLPRALVRRVLARVNARRDL